MKKFLLLLISLASLVAMGVACKDKEGEGANGGSANQTVESVLQEMEISLSSKSFPYDGKEHSLEIEGELPARAVVVWQNNSLKDVGENLVFATVRCAGYKEVSLKATLTVVGQDMAAGLVLESESLSVGYGATYAFTLADEALLPDGAVCTETYIDRSSGKVVDGKPDFGGEFRYVLQISAPGYNAKTIYGELTIARPNAESVRITNLPSVAIAQYKGRAALLPGIPWTPEVEVLPKGHADVEIELATEDATRIQYKDGAFVALESYGDCKITVSIEGTEISATYTVAVPECAFYYEGFEDKSEKLYIVEYVKEMDKDGKMDYTKNEKDEYVYVAIPRGQEVRLDANGKAERDAEGNILFFDKAVPDVYYGAFASSTASSEILTQNGNRVMHVTVAEGFYSQYSFLDIDGCPGGGWQAGKYYLEMEVTGSYPFIFYWVDPTVEGGVKVLADTVGTSSDASAVVKNGKIVIEFTLKEEDITEGNAIRFASSKKDAFDFTVDNIMIIKVQ